MSDRDKIFRSKLEDIEPFQFNENVANVFDDMVDRSIPNYHEIHRILVDLILRYYPDQGVIYDLGCSTGTTIALLEQAFSQQNRPIEFIGIDTSKPMIEKAKMKCEKVRQVKFLNNDISRVEFKNAQVFILNYTLQFFKVEGRLQLLKKIYDSLPTGGILILSEKINSQSPHMQKSITDLYYDFKRRNGYSELEIAQKREALEDVLNPLTPEEQMIMIKKAGFEESEMLFRWYNFASYLAVKSPSKDK
ncbi:MAG: carboxy-S-adenosyl-L-methionine synthase CmoA [Halobacteriovoraceae bacterium]|nr:carboxy-S-adenosyl-L-methionine synthase CmoA [Halobacteriovoraceae bacterium]